MAGRINAKKTRIDGFVFDSGAEARRYQELRLMQAAGKIVDLRVHPVYPLDVNGKLICNYEADFRYWVFKPGAGTVGLSLGQGVVVEDVKGMVTDVFRLKAKLFEAIYGIKLLITPASDYRAPRPKAARRRARR